MGVIVVGVDGSQGSTAALRWALEEARLRGSSLRVVHAYQSPPLPATEAGMGVAGGIGVPAVYTDDSERLRHAIETQARHLIEHSLRRVGADSIEGVDIEQSAVQGPAAQTLIEAG